VDGLHRPVRVGFQKHGGDGAFAAALGNGGDVGPHFPQHAEEGPGDTRLVPHAVADQTQDAEARADLHGIHHPAGPLRGEGFL